MIVIDCNDIGLWLMGMLVSWLWGRLVGRLDLLSMSGLYLVGNGVMGWICAFWALISGNDYKAKNFNKINMYDYLRGTVGL